MVRKPSLKKTTMKRDITTPAAAAAAEPRGVRNRELLRETLEEFEHRGNYIRIYPSKGTDYYDMFFETPKVSNKILYKYMYAEFRMEKPSEERKSNTHVLPSVNRLKVSYDCLRVVAFNKQGSLEEVDKRPGTTMPPISPR